MVRNNELTRRKLTERGEQLEILLVEDDEGDIRLVEEAFSDARLTNTVRVVRDLDEALGFLDRRGEPHSNLPDIVLLNVRLAGTGDEDGLQELFGNNDLSVVPIAPSEDGIELIDGLTHPPDQYLTKPLDPAAFIDLARGFDDVWISVVKRQPE